MSSPIPPSNGADPNAPVPNEPSLEPTPIAPESVAPHDTESLRDRMLTPEETESMLRGVMPGQDEATSVAEQQHNEEQSRLAGDFFADVPGEQRQLAPTPPAPPDPAVQPQLPPAAPVPQAPQVAQPQQVPPQIPQATPQEAALQAQNAMLQQSLAAMQQQLNTMQQAPAAAPAAPSGQQAQPQGPKFNFNVPAGHMQALGAEDAGTRQAALDSILNGVANTMYQQFQHELDERLTNQVPQAVSQQVNAAQERQNVHQDMYGTYPELSAHSNLVFATAEQLQAQGLGAAGWTPDFRDAIAERLSPMVPGLDQKVQQVRAQRLAAMSLPPINPGALPQPQGAVPQVPQLPATLPPGSVVGGSHGPVAQGAAAPQPVLMRNAAGQIVPMVPQQNLAGPQVRPGGAGIRVDPAVQDIWNTLGY